MPILYEFFILVLSILIIFETNVFYTIIYFVLIVLSFSFSFFLYNLLYLSFILIIVYSTAIVILFSFIIMKYKSYNKLFIDPFQSFQSIVFLSLVFVFLIVNIILYLNTPIQTETIVEIHEIQRMDLIYNIGKYFFNEKIYIIQIFIAAIILLFPILAILYL